MYDEFDDRDENIAGGADPVNDREDERQEFSGEENDIDVIDGCAAEESAVDAAYDAQPRHTEAEPGQGFYHYSYREENRRPQTEPFPEQKEKKQSSGGSGRRPLWKSVAICAGLAVVFGVVGSAAFQVTNLVGRKVLPRETEYTVGTADTVAQTEAQTEMKVSGTTVSTTGTPSQVAKNAMPSIVAITNKGVQEVQMFFRTYQQEVESAGSGVIVSQNEDELLIATNNHVVADATELSVCFTVDTEDQEDAVVEAQVKGTDVEHDLAIIAVKLSDIPDNVKSQIKTAPIGDSTALELGQQVVAIGNALGSGQSVTVGYISALNREVTVSDGSHSNTVTNSMIQTDAAINGGNSGGALLNMAGELIGINSAKAVDTGVEGMGYAIPMQTAQPILEELMQRKTRTAVDTEKMGYMGVTPRDVSDEAKEVYNMPAGAFIYEVEEGSPAEAAGIKKGDIITKMDGQSITSKADLFDRMNYYEAGETIDVIVATAEGGEYVERTVSVTLGERPEDLSSGTQQDGQDIPQDPYGDDGYGDGDGYGYDFSDPFQQFFGN